MIKKNYFVYKIFFTVFLSLCMVLPSIIPAMEIENGITLSEDNKIITETYIFFTNGTVKKSFNNISISESRNMIELLYKPTEIKGSINKVFNEKLSILKKFGILNKEISADVFSNSIENKFNLTENKIPIPTLLGDNKIIFNLGGYLSFMGPGVGFGFGLNSYVPVIGWDLLDIIYMPIGWVTSIGIPNPLQNKFGQFWGIVLGFSGVLVRVLYPFVYGPFFIAIGFSGPTLWIKGGIPFIPFI